MERSAVTTKLLDFPAALAAAGVNVRTVDGWDEPARAGYFWREDDDEPAGHMHHHTAGTAYTPSGGTDKANGFAGLSYKGSDRLYQERYQGVGYEAVFTITNAYPAPISSGAGNIGVLEKVRRGVEVVGRPGADTTNWYGNTHYWNTEWVLNGIGAWIDQEVWDMMVLVCQVQNDLMGWTRANHLAHAHHTKRKVDLWGGQFSSTNFDGYDLTLLALRDDMDGAVVIPPPPNGDNTVFFDYVMGWFDTLTDGEIDQMQEAGLFHGDAAWWKTLRDLGESGRDAGKNAEVIHFYHTVETSGWAN